MAANLLLVKVGGAELAEGPDLERLVRALRELAAESSLIVVHGGGPEIAQLQNKLGIEPHFVEGLRVTDEASMAVAEMVLSGAVNKRLVAHLVAAGMKALGLSGVDGGLLRARRMEHARADLGLVGEITKVNVEMLRWITDGGFTPVISPISLGESDRALNVNADHAALAIAGAMRVAEAIFLTDVPGVLAGGELLTTLDAAQAEQLIALKVITGGMVPKVRSALDALRGGVGRVRITNLVGLDSGSGTWLYSVSAEVK
ncbi:MAG: acetylglutamate kinase [Anaerolineae bacterium]